MKSRIGCPSCGGVAEATTTTVKVIVDDNVLSIHDVPCYICSQCGEVMYVFSVAEKLERIRKEYAHIKNNTQVLFAA